jgi:hypothetical protein
MKPKTLTWIILAAVWLPAAALKLRLEDWVHERWLNLPHTAPPAASSGAPGATQAKPRFWGAR